MATRLYYPSSGAAEISPAFDAAWQFTTGSVRLPLNTSKLTAAVAGSYIGPWTTGNKALSHQFVSAPMNAGVVFTSGSTTVKAQIRTDERNTTDNVNLAQLGVRVVAADGSTVQSTLLAVANYFANAEFLDSARNATFADGDALTASYTTAEGDYLVVELGFSDTAGVTPEARLRLGGTGADCAENETDTTGVGWIEFSNNITFTDVANMLMLLGAGQA